MFKEIAGLTSILKQAQKFRDRMEDVTRQLKAKRATGAAGGGMVEVEVNGLGECISVKIDPLLVERGEREMIEDLLPAAFNQALAKAKQQHGRAMQAVADGIPVPGLNEAMAKMMSGDAAGDLQSDDDDDDHDDNDNDIDDEGERRT
jgi:DNA-binding YbaB/EbfC family protein